MRCFKLDRYTYTHTETNTTTNVFFFKLDAVYKSQPNIQMRRDQETIEQNVKKSTTASHKQMMGFQVKRMSTKLNIDFSDECVFK